MSPTKILNITIYVASVARASPSEQAPFTSEIVGSILVTRVKRVCQHSAGSCGFPRVLRFPPTGEVDSVG